MSKWVIEKLIAEMPQDALTALDNAAGAKYRLDLINSNPTHTVIPDTKKHAQTLYSQYANKLSDITGIRSFLKIHQIVDHVNKYGM